MTDVGMTVGTELKEIKDTLRKITRDMTRIRQAQKQMKEEMYEVKKDLQSFRNSWKKEKKEIEKRLLELEEDQVKRELVQKLALFEQMGEAMEMKEKQSNDDIKGLSMPMPCRVKKNDLQKCIGHVRRKEQSHESTVNIEYKRLCVNEKHMILKDGHKLIKQLFTSGKTDL